MSGPRTCSRVRTILSEKRPFRWGPWSPSISPFSESYPIPVFVERLEQSKASDNWFRNRRSARSSVVHRPDLPPVAFEARPDVEDGRLTVGDEPGLGVEVNFDGVEEYPFIEESLTEFHYDE